jgi:hypothetical protein
VPPAASDKLFGKISFGGMISSIISIIINIAEVPTAAALCPYTMNIEKTKQTAAIVKPIRTGFVRASGVILAMRKINKMQNNIPLRFRINGPGSSVILTQKAPNARVKPSSN